MLGRRSQSRARLRAELGIALFAIVLSLAPSVCGAEAATLPFVVDYRPGDGCDPVERFSEQLIARTARARRARPSEIGLRYRIAFSGSKDALVGYFTSIDVDGNALTRVIPTAKCDEMVAAMALIAAIFMDPNGVSVADVASVPTFTAPRETKTDATVRSNMQARWVFAVGAAAFLASAVAPDLRLGFAGEFDVKFETQRPLSPWIGLTAMRTGKAPFETTGGTAVFDWLALRLTLSPMRWPSTGPFALRPALFTEVGRLNGSGKDTAAPDSTHLLWTAAGALLRVEVTPQRWFAIAVDGGLVVPMRHDSFYFTPNPPLFRIPTLAFWSQLGVAAQF
jgi:hypothetical protein